jgi:N-acetylglucosamine-6-phosphate deacetylase
MIQNAKNVTNQLGIVFQMRMVMCNKYSAQYADIHAKRGKLENGNEIR